jgi:tRNA A-37 threonylcarbamoyl transferase component Bud32
LLQIQQHKSRKTGKKKERRREGEKERRREGERRVSLKGRGEKMPRRAAPMPSADEMSDCITGGSAPEASAAAPAAASGDWYGNFPDGVRDMSADLEIAEAEVLGEGSESTVYLGKVAPGGQNVAAKVVKIRGYDDLKRFKREMAVLAALAPHPHVACLVGADPTPGRRTIVLPFAEMGDLATLIHDRGVQLGADLALCYALQVADALQHVHARGFVHKDVKSANCLVSGDWRSVCLSDFGLADRMHAPGLTDAELRAAAISGNRGPTGGVQRVRIVGTLVSRE